MKTFEGSYLGDRAKIGPTTRLECKVCWYVYDPARGRRRVAGSARHAVRRAAAALDLPDTARAMQDQFLVLRR